MATENGSNKLKYASRDALGECTVEISSQGVSKIVEIVYVLALEQIAEEYKTCKDKARRKELKERYRVAAKELNSQYKTPVFNETL